MRQAEKKEAPSPVKAMAPLFHEFDVVALKVPLPDFGLDAGTWGNVLAVLDDGTYEVEFIERDDTPITRLRVRQEALELVWAEG